MSATDRTDAPDDEAATGGSLPQEKVDDRPDIAPVEPEDYPEADRAKGA
ncbi:hypothetical protein [Sphingomonas sp. PAMC 26605]|nr:hypothetical protein [Sphingomonas sp. PAMC 26605]